MNTPDKTNELNYSEMFQKAKAGTISQEVWFDYCQKILAKSLDQNKDVLQRLKAR